MVPALKSLGTQDKWMRDRHELFDMRQVFLKNRHQYEYRKLDIEVTAFKDTINKITVKPSCDLINNVDLMIANPENIKSVEVTYAGHRFDKIWSWEQLKINAQIFRRPITQGEDGVYMVPMCMAPFHKNNLALPSSKYHPLNIYIEFKQPYNGPFELYANNYFLAPEDRAALVDNSHEYATIQSQHCDAEKIRKGVNQIKIWFNHPVYLIYFYGIDKSKVKNIRVLLDDYVYYDGPIMPLEHAKKTRGFQEVDALMVFFSNEPINRSPTSTINFSRIDRAILEIDTDEEDGEIYLMGLNVQGVRYSNGMYGLIYSK